MHATTPAAVEKDTFLTSPPSLLPPLPLPQQILKSNKWGFTNWDREEYVRRRLDGTLIGDGVGVKYIPQHGPLGKKPGT